eukprot:TRINITY_DN8281_c0_g1_i7.p3 TRINITY_DN8281_c0_g1~~TRINITY_DN8281_c0_g1_i7.p3  ORF type:complete len:105 (+),score=3.71 TRINITY_DN8281_c0_g1_i7:165-479(+)
MPSLQVPQATRRLQVWRYLQVLPPSAQQLVIGEDSQVLQEARGGISCQVRTSCTRIAMKHVHSRTTTFLENMGEYHEPKDLMHANYDAICRMAVLARLSLAHLR